jgi:hypothetical protein
MKPQDPFKVNSSFSGKTKFLQIYWDATSLTALKKCPRLYQYQIIEGWQPKTQADPLRFGILYHEAMKIYAYAILETENHDESLLIVLEFLLKNSVDYSTDEDGIRICKIWEADKDNRSRYSLCRAVIWYLELNKERDATTVILNNGKPAVELSFKFDSELAFNGESFMLCGHIDKLLQFGKDVYVEDYKTTNAALTSKFFDQFSPDNQMSLYSIAGKVITNENMAGVIINGIQLGVHYNRYERGFANRSEAQLDEWMCDFQHWLKQAITYAKNEYWPMNDTRCNEYGGCKYKSICKKDPSVREIFLKGDFKREYWNPTKDREL